MLDQKFWDESIFSLFPKEILEKVDFEIFVRPVQPGEILVEDGQLFNELYIPISTTVLLMSNSGNEQTSCVGSVTRGRSINLYSFLRSLPATYAFVAQDQGDILAIPREFLEKLFSLAPEVKFYLLKVTKDPILRTLVKEFNSLGVSTGFVVQFIAHLGECVAQPQSSVVKISTPFAGPLFLAEGQFLMRHGSSQQKSWIVPLKSWIGWSESIEKTVSTSTILSTAKSNFFQIKNQDILRLQKHFPEDFSILDAWIKQGEFRQFEDQTADQEIDSADDLFSEAIETKERKWSLPFVKQSNEMDCGPACLAMMSLYFGKNISTHFWRSKLSTDRSGTTLYDLSSTTEKHGFISHCLEVTDLKTIDSFMLPFIAPRKYHYMVVYKIKKETVVIGDPAIGIREISFGEFYDGFSQVGLFLKPNTEFLKLPESSAPWKHYVQLFKGLESDLAMAFVCGILAVILSLVPPMVGQVILDDVLVQKNTGLFWILLGISAGVSVISLFVSWAQGYYFNFIVSKYNFRATSVFIQKMFALPYHFFAARHVGDFTHRLAEMGHLRSFLTGTLFEFSLNMLTMIIYGAALFFISVKLTLFVLLLAPPMILLPMIFSRYMSRLYSEVFAKAAEQTSHVTDLIEGITVIKSSGAEWTARTRFEDKLLSFINVQNRFSMTALKVSTSTFGYFQFINLAIMGLSVYMGLRGEISAGQVVSFALITHRILGPLLAITKQWDRLIETKSVLTRLNDIFLTPSENKKETPLLSAPKKTVFRGEIEFRDVWFRYGSDSSEWVLKGVNFKIEAGQKVSIVGPSGSGKSTLAFLLTRMYEPTSGFIFVDGKDYREYSIEWLREQMGLLPQEARLFSGSIAENIGFSKLDINEEKMQSAAARSAALDFIIKKPQGFYHHVPHGGHGFSVGEKQRIALARLFYQDPSIVILDEATSALDGISEQDILENISQEMKQRTIINIAHRYSTVVRSEYAVVLFEGRCVGMGTLSYLKENNLIFRRLFSANEKNLIRPLERIS